MTNRERYHHETIEQLLKAVSDNVAAQVKDESKLEWMRISVCVHGVTVDHIIDNSEKKAEEEIFLAKAQIQDANRGLEEAEKKLAHLKKRKQQ